MIKAIPEIIIQTTTYFRIDYNLEEIAEGQTLTDAKEHIRYMTNKPKLLNIYVNKNVNEEFPQDRNDPPEFPQDKIDPPEFPQDKIDPMILPALIKGKQFCSSYV